jgi:hypothetical protein
VRLSAQQRDVIRALAQGDQLRPEGRHYRMYKAGLYPSFRVDCKTQWALSFRLGLIERKDAAGYGLSAEGREEAQRRGWQKEEGNG